MLAALFLASLAYLTGATAALLVRPRRPGRPARRPSAAAASVLAAGVVAAASTLLGVPTPTAAGVGALLAAAGLAWLPATTAWNVRGHLAWTAVTASGAAYLAYMWVWTWRSDLGPAGTVGGTVLWLLEAAGFALGLMYGWELVDVLARRRWRRRCPAGVDDDDGPFPFVSLHVPAHDEPPDLVIATLTSLRALDYPAFEIIMIDDNTADPALWAPVAAWCADHDITFRHLEDWPGFKSGALNVALAMTDPRAEVVGVVDADYLVEPDYLRRCAPLFARRPRLGFLQTPQDYREWEHARYYRHLYFSYEYFFAVSQPSRNERDGAIFGGTMGLIRRQALDGVGGWDEWCITEDAELSLRLLRAGWEGQHVERSFGHGIMPLTFEALKRQRFRWCFGGVQILRRHWRSLLPWDRQPDNHLSTRQRYDYLAGGVQWFGDLLGLAFAALLLLGAADLVVGGGVVVRRLSGALLVVPPLLVGLAVVRSVGLFRRRTDARRTDALGALSIWLSLGFTVASACSQAVRHADGVFLRTPKTRGDTTWRDAVRANRTESALGLLLAALVPPVLLRAAGGATLTIAALLLWHAGGLLAAPVHSLSALRAPLTPELAEARRQERRRDRAGAGVRPWRVGLAGAAAGLVAVLLVGLLSPQPTEQGPAPDVVSEARGQAPSAPAEPTTTVTPDAPAAPSREPTVPSAHPSATTAPGLATATTSSALPAGAAVAASTTTAPAPTTTAPAASTTTRAIGPPTTTTTTAASSTTTTTRVAGPPSTPTTRPHP